MEKGKKKTGGGGRYLKENNKAKGKEENGINRSKKDKIEEKRRDGKRRIGKT
jgi:hypothetical protein